MKWLLCLLLILLSTRLQAADWTDAQWEALHTVSAGTYQGMMRGLQCTGDVLYLTAYTQPDPDTMLAKVFRIRLGAGGPDPAFAELDVPQEVQYFLRDIGYDSVDRARPALMTRYRLWTQANGQWQAMLLGDSATDSPREMGAFAYDSTGALHYATSGPSWGSDSLCYHRRGGGQADRDTSFFGGWEYGFTSGTYVRLWNPTANSVMIANGSLDVPPTYEMYHLYFFTSTDGAAFSRMTLFSDVHGRNPQITVAPWGGWYYTFLQGCFFNVYGFKGQGPEDYSRNDPYTTEMSAWRVVPNPLDSTFEAAGIQRNTSPLALTFLKLNREMNLWEEDRSIQTPANIASLHFSIDTEGHGHLFMLDSTTLWHYGQPILSSPANSRASMPADISLAAYPNPFNSSTRISFSRALTGMVELRVYDVAGRAVRTLVSGMFTAGSHQVSFEGKDLSSGLYFVQLNAQGKTATQKLMLLK